ncbi:hypothetical protein ACFL6M_04035 [Candidatus Eisenbacteria bacterium]|uniref:Tetratricopeptide repeat protein n=1 Tax=Eiseniibacteriota bacterium TaxID=2212470 RepID=A0ABV6YK95_UNCEI
MSGTRRGAVRKIRPWAAAVLAAPVLAGCLFALPVQSKAAGNAPQSVVERIRDGEAAYEAGRYEEAVSAYRQALSSGWHSSALYYNLGCACFKAGSLGWAVAYLEEARRLAPRDASIRHNLRVASSRVRDRLPEENTSRLLALLSQILDGYAPSDAIAALLVLVWVAAVALVMRWLGRGLLSTAGRWGLWLVAALLILCVAGILLKAYQVSSAPSGVIVAEEAQVHSGPREGETVQFVLHAGTLLHLGRDAGDWREVWLSDEMRGWVPSSAVAALSQPVWLP